jgi:hypothetical protein
MSRVAWVAAFQCALQLKLLVRSYACGAYDKLVLGDVSHALKSMNQIMRPEHLMLILC